MALEPAPNAVVDADGFPRFGTYQGSLREVDLSRLDGPYQLPLPLRLLKHKKWLYTFMATPEVIAVAAVADLTYTANAFAMVVDRQSKRVLLDESFIGLPGPLARVGSRPNEGVEARFRALGASFSASRPSGSERVRLRVEVSRLLPLPHRALDWDGELLTAGGPPPLTVISPVSDGGVVNVTQKWGALLTFGTLRAGGRTFRLDGGVGGTDYSNGYLARRTAWRWAFACGRLDDGTPLGLNLVEGFNEEMEQANENALWVGQKLFPLSRARFEFDRHDPLDRWHVRTKGGEVDVTFRPIGAHRERRDYKVVMSRFVQPLGTFSGTLRAGGNTWRVDELPGVTEDQDILW